MRYIDTNVFIDAFVDQKTASRPRSMALLNRLIFAEEEAATSELVLAEVVFVLRTNRASRKTPAEIAAALAPVLRSETFIVNNKPLWLRALELMVTYNIDMPDAHLGALAEQDAGEVVSLDSDFDRIPGITRLEP